MRGEQWLGEEMEGENGVKKEEDDDGIYSNDGSEVKLLRD